MRVASATYVIEGWARNHVTHVVAEGRCMPANLRRWQLRGWQLFGSARVCYQMQALQLTGWWW